MVGAFVGAFVGKIVQGSLKSQVDVKAVPLSEIQAFGTIDAKYGELQTGVPSAHSQYHPPWAIHALQPWLEYCCNGWQSKQSDPASQIDPSWHRPSAMYWPPAMYLQVSEKWLQVVSAMGGVAGVGAGAGTGITVSRKAATVAAFAAIRRALS